MGGWTARCRIGVLILLFISIAVSSLYHLAKPVPNGCTMTYMYPTYIPITFTPPPNSSAFHTRYKLYMYHEGWRKIDFADHIKKLTGVPLLFIPGNGGSYKQVRSLAAESDRSYQAGPLESTSEQSRDRYVFRLDWFAVDLVEEHSAMDAQILEDQTEYDVYAVHRNN